MSKKIKESQAEQRANFVTTNPDTVFETKIKLVEEKMNIVKSQFDQNEKDYAINKEKLIRTYDHLSGRLEELKEMSEERKKGEETPTVEGEIDGELEQIKHEQDAIV